MKLTKRGVRVLLVPELGECLIWTGARQRKGYGNVKRGGRNHLVHRLAWGEVHGPIPDGLQVLHKCDIRACFELSHLFLGTNADNVQDRQDKRRSRRAVATEAELQAVRDLAARGVPQRQIAVMFDISQATVSNWHRRLHHDY